LFGKHVLHLVDLKSPKFDYIEPQMITLQELSESLNSLLNVSLIKDYCPNGIQVEGKKQISQVATAVSASLEVIEKAIEKKADLLLVHHGLLWSGDSLRITGAKSKKLRLLLEHGLSLMAYHLPLDAHSLLGNNWKAAGDLGWDSLEPFGEVHGTIIGVKGQVQPQGAEIFQKSLENYYQHPATSVLAGSKPIRHVALISGGAFREIDQAINSQVDAYVTGSFDEPAWNAARENEIHFFALGHHATERVGIQALGQYIHQRWNLSTTFIDSHNPF
jgi:dinuclear metal center YbgI/SA1388 family protein